MLDSLLAAASSETGRRCVYVFALIFHVFDCVCVSHAILDSSATYLFCSITLLYHTTHSPLIRVLLIPFVRRRSDFGGNTVGGGSQKRRVGIAEDGRPTSPKRSSSMKQPEPHRSVGVLCSRVSPLFTLLTFECLPFILQSAQRTWFKPLTFLHPFHTSSHISHPFTHTHNTVAVRCLQPVPLWTIA